MGYKPLIDRLANYPRPLPTHLVRQLAREQMETFKAAGIKFVEYLGANNDEDDCEAIKAMKNVAVEIHFAPLLPLPGCDRKYCKCILGASERQR